MEIWKTNIGWLSCLLLVLCQQTTKGATHWVVTEDGKIHTQDDSVFTLRRPYDLVSLLEQEKRAEALKRIKTQLMAQKETIEASAGADSEAAHGTIVIDSETDVEQVVYSTNDDCTNAGKTLPEFDLYVGTMLFLPPVTPALVSKKFNDFNDSDDERLISDERLRTEDFEQPNCSQFYNLDFSMHSYEHLQSMRDRKNLEIEPESDIHLTITSVEDIDSYGNGVYQALKQNNTSWVLYTMASYYWRAKGNGYEAVECLRRALHCAPYNYKHIPLASLGNVLHRAHHTEEAAIVMHHAIDVSSENPISHFTLGNIYAVLADYNKSLICYENVLKLDKSFTEAKLRYHAVLCHQKVEKALRAQHEYTLEELQGYQKQQELWLHYQQKLLSEQAPPGVLLEQRLQYREHKIREIIDSNLNNGGHNMASGGGNVGATMKKMNHGTVNGSGGGSGNHNAEINHGSKTGSSPSPTCSAANGGNNGGNGESDCHMVPILIPITFVPPS
ncbi:Tetratricopeptide repeat protein 17-like protein [Dinothrombium tinctorium]|uniref:Tetratricopeptide repeat protein 17-like protein n=1 Tax=Dinothrombium tinctorium TaxID=1965070 RepID=A0A3S3QML7_9ACAR|nr:Tetratricopeptide repeat protein 17-like protein [Dinothrombium tinctorium]